MIRKNYHKILDKVMKIVNSGVVLMTDKEEYEYKRRIAKDLTEWVKSYRNLYLLRKRSKNG
jgi:hypothetical protein